MFEQLLNIIKSRILRLFLITLGLIFIAEKELNGFKDIFLDALVSSKSIFLSYKIGLSDFLFLLVFIYIMLRISDKKYRKESKEHYPDFEHFESREKKPVETKIFEYSRYSNGRFIKKREITIFNTEEEEIQSIEGKVILLNYKVDILQEKLKFALSNLGPSHGVKIYDEIIDDGEESWNEFHTYIDRLDIGGKISKNIKVYGKQIPKSYYLVLNKCRFFRISCMKKSFEISWVIEIWKTYIKPWLLNYPRLPKIYGNFPSGVGYCLVW